MTAQEIQRKVILVVAANSEFTIQQIEALFSPPEKDPNLDKFISPSKKARLATSLKREMACVKSTELTNLLFTSITTLGQLIKKVRSFCETPNL